MPRSTPWGVSCKILSKGGPSLLEPCCRTGPKGVTASLPAVGAGREWIVCSRPLLGPTGRGVGGSSSSGLLGLPRGPARGSMRWLRQAHPLSICPRRLCGRLGLQRQRGVWLLLPSFCLSFLPTRFLICSGPAQPTTWKFPFEPSHGHCPECSMPPLTSLFLLLGPLCIDGWANLGLLCVLCTWDIGLESQEKGGTKRFITVGFPSFFLVKPRGCSFVLLQKEYGM